MAKLYNQKTVSANQASVGQVGATSYAYKGFSSANAVDNFKLYDIDLVKQDIINHFYIRKGEKLENPNFGTIIWDMIFEQFTPQVKEMIAKDLIKKKETLSDKEIYLLQKLAGVKNPKK